MKANRICTAAVASDPAAVAAALLRLARKSIPCNTFLSKLNGADRSNNNWPPDSYCGRCCLPAVVSYSSFAAGSLAAVR